MRIYHHICKHIYFSFTLTFNFISREWSSKHQKELEAKRDQERKDEEELRKNAAKELENYKNEREKKIQQLRQENRSSQSKTGGNGSGKGDWEVVANLINTKETTKNPTKKDTSRMKEVILSLVKDVSA